MKSFKIGFPSFVREKKVSSCPEMYSMVDPTLSTKEMEVEKDEQIVVVLEREAREETKLNYLVKSRGKEN